MESNNIWNIVCYLEESQGYQKRQFYFCWMFCETFIFFDTRFKGMGNQYQFWAISCKQGSFSPRIFVCSIFVAWTKRIAWISVTTFQSKSRKLYCGKRTSFPCCFVKINQKKPPIIIFCDKAQKEEDFFFSVRKCPKLSLDFFLNNKSLDNLNSRSDKR